MDFVLYGIGVFATALYRLILFAIIAFGITLFLEGNKFEIFFSTVAILVAANLIIWIIDTIIQIGRYLFTRHNTVNLMHSDLSHELYLPMNYSSDPDEWIEENVEHFNVGYLEDWLTDKNSTVEEFKERFLTPYSRLIYLSALRNGVKQSNFLTWILHTRSLRKALKQKQFHPKA